MHDLGFLFWPTWKRWYDLTGDPAINEVVIEAGRTLAVKVLAVRVTGRVGVLGARVTLADEQGRMVARRDIGSNVSVGCRGPDTVALAVRRPGRHVLTVRFSDGTTKTRLVDLSFAPRVVRVLVDRHSGREDDGQSLSIGYNSNVGSGFSAILAVDIIRMGGEWVETDPFYGTTSIEELDLWLVPVTLSSVFRVRARGVTPYAGGGVGFYYVAADHAYDKDADQREESDSDGVVGLHVLGGFASRQRPILDNVGKALAFDVIHREVVSTVVLAYLVDGNDVGMLEVGCRLGLVAKPLDVGLTGQFPRKDHLQGDNPVEAYLPSPVDDAHAATNDLFDNLVVAEISDGDRPSLVG